jgi:hypothetical protein
MIWGVMGGTAQRPQGVGQKMFFQRLGAALAAGLSERLSERTAVLAGALLR